MNSIDIFIIVFILFFFIRGFFRGFVLELITLVGLILGYILAISYLDTVSNLIIQYFPDLPLSAVNIFSFAVLFIATNLILKLAGDALTRTLKFVMLGWLNRWLGGIFGALKSLILLSLLVLIIDFLPFSDSLLENTTMKNSQLYPLLDMLGPELYYYISNISTML
jgi:membrane protein required for colicin V production